MTYPSTSLILALRALEVPRGQECVDRATGMLAAGHDGEHLAMLASMAPPLDPFETAALRDRALGEVGAPDVAGPEAVRAYAAERLINSPDDESDLLEELRGL